MRISLSTLCRLPPPSSASPYRVLFCHGLGSAKADAQLVQQWVKRQAVTATRPFQFQAINYNGYNDEEPESPWTVNSWSRDLAIELGDQWQQKVVIICVSASVQAFLRAICRKPLLLQNIAGLLLISPAVGMQVDNYVRRVLPDHMDALSKGKAVEHPSTDPAVQIRVDLASLKDYSQNCVLQMEKPLPVFNFPVRIVHGIYDKLVPFANSVKLLDKIRAKDKILFLTSSGHSITDNYTLLQSMESLWNALKIDNYTLKKGRECQYRQKETKLFGVALEKTVMATY